MQKVKCRICGVTLFKVTATHLRRVHNMTMKDYLEKFPDEKIEGENVERKKDVKFSLEKLEEREPQVLEVSMSEIKNIVSSLDTEDELEELGKDFKKVEERVTTQIPMSETKKKVYNLLRSLFGFVETNYFIEKVDLSGHLSYRVITDFYVPPRKLIIDFPDMFWHNFDILSEKIKNGITRDGYTIVRIYGKEQNEVEIVNKLIEAGVIPQDFETL